MLSKTFCLKILWKNPGQLATRPAFPVLLADFTFLPEKPLELIAYYFKAPAGRYAESF